MGGSERIAIRRITSADDLCKEDFVDCMKHLFHTNQIKIAEVSYLLKLLSFKVLYSPLKTLNSTHKLLIFLTISILVYFHFIPKC